MRDLAGDRSSDSLLKHYREMSRKWRKEQNDTFEACTWYRDRWTQDRNITATARGTAQNLQALNAMMKRWYPTGQTN
jgi:hypothetical protein